MSIAALILGSSGSGKSTSLRNLDPAKTLLIQCIKKPLPFRATGWKTRISLKSEGNVIQTSDPVLIEKLLRTSPHEIVVIDDYQAVMVNELLSRSSEKGYDKFTDIGKHAWEIIRAAADLAEHKRVFILSHTETTEAGRVKAKTIGRMLDEKITLEGMFSIVLRTAVINDQYVFRTRNNGSDTVKTPLGMFEQETIPNDLAAVDAAIVDYYQLAQAA